MSMTVERWDAVVAEVTSHAVCPSAHPDSIVQHLRHLLEGYRCAVLDPEADPSDHPYSPGSARDGSWQEGLAMGRADLAERSGVAP